MRFDVDYSGNAGDSWSQATITLSDKFSVVGSDALSFDLLYDAAKLGDASFKSKVTSDPCATLAVSIIGCNTSYKGALYMDNISLGVGEPAKDYSVDSTVQVTGGAVPAI